MTHFLRSASLAASLVVAIACVDSAHAASTDAERCASAKMKAASQAWSAKGKCYAKALASSSAVDPECLSKAQTKFDSAFAKVEANGGCSITANAAPIRAKLDDGVEDIAGDLGCGNGVLDGDETCDDGGLVGGDGCSSTCVVECGDGVVTGAEQCDDTNLTNGDGCDSNCTTTGCGNGVVTGVEVCDDGNHTNGDGCDDNCTASACGNGAWAPNEECDDGDTDPGDGCSASCALESTCPCWTTASLNGAFSLADYSAAGRGGLGCSISIPSMNIVYLWTQDTCSLPPPNETYTVERIGLYTDSGRCSYRVVADDTDPSNSGTCTVFTEATVDQITDALQGVACYWTARKSEVAMNCP